MRIQHDVEQEELTQTVRDLFGVEPEPRTTQRSKRNFKSSFSGKQRTLERKQQRKSKRFRSNL